MGRVNAIIVTGNGTNCEMEMRHACELAGAERADIVHISALLHGEVRLDEYNFLNLPGGFLDGDDLGAAKAAANRLLHSRVRGTDEPLREQFRRFIAAGKLILGVCNGFQLLVKLGFLPLINDSYEQSVTLTHNESGKFEDRWVCLQVNAASPCIFTRGITELYLPVRHGEGRFLARDAQVLTAIEENNLVAMRYSKADFRTATQDYPDNPNGAVNAIAGICNPTGRILGLMPHPEAYLHFTNHPRWTREQLPEEGAGLRLFQNAVSFIRAEL